MKAANLAGTLALVLSASALVARADNSKSGADASYGARGAKAKIEAVAEGENVEFLVFAWTAASQTGTWKLYTVKSGDVIDEQVFQSGPEDKLTDDEMQSLQGRVRLRWCSLHYCPKQDESERVWSNAYKRQWWPAQGHALVPHDLMAGNAYVQSLPVHAGFAVQKQELLPRRKKQVKDTQYRTEEYWDYVVHEERGDPVITFSPSGITKTGPNSFSIQLQPSVSYGKRIIRTPVKRTRSVPYDVWRWEEIPNKERIWVRTGNDAQRRPPGAPNPESLIKANVRYRESDDQTRMEVTVHASVTYARAYAVTTDENGRKRFAETVASASPEGTRSDSEAGEIPRPAPYRAPQRATQPAAQRSRGRVIQFGRWKGRRR